MGEVTGLATKGSRGLENRKKLHYTMMKAGAKRIQHQCQRYLFIAPDFESDLRCIPTITTPNFIEEWLMEQEETDPCLAEAWRSEAFRKLAKPMFKQLQDGKAI